MAEEIKTVFDVTGAELTPYHPELCKGNGETLDENGNLIECCCDECDFLIGCLKAPNTQKKEQAKPLDFRKHTLAEVKKRGRKQA